MRPARKAPALIPDLRAVLLAALFTALALATVDVNAGCLHDASSSGHPADDTSCTTWIVEGMQKSKSGAT